MKIDLPSWHTERIEESIHDYLFHVTYKPEPPRCHYCHGGLCRHGTRPQRIKDTPRNGKRVTILLTRNRYRCATCGKTVLQPLPDVDGRAQMTRRLRLWIEEQSAVLPFAAVARQAGVDEKTVRNVSAMANGTYG